MVYQVEDYAEVLDRERPDFTLRRFYSSIQPFGVEITQMFENESIARLNLADNYLTDLFEGGDYKHKDDRKQLDASDITVYDKEGNVKHDSLRVVVTKEPTRADFRKKLAETIRDKSERGYDTSGFSHLNLIILDWFHLPFDSTKFFSTDIIDDEVLSTLIEAPFHEVFLIIYDTKSLASRNDDGTVTPRAVIVELQQLLVVSRYFLTASAIDSHTDVQCQDIRELGRRSAFHLTQAQRIGDLVEHDGQTCVRYRGTVVGMQESGAVVFEYEDPPYFTTDVDSIDRLSEPATSDVSEFVGSHGFSWTHTRPARG